MLRTCSRNSALPCRAKVHPISESTMEFRVRKRENCRINEVHKVSVSAVKRCGMQHFGISKGITKCKTEKVFSVRQNLGTLMSLENPNSVHGFKGLVDDLTDNHSWSWLSPLVGLLSVVQFPNKLGLSRPVASIKCRKSSGPQNPTSIEKLHSKRRRRLRRSLLRSSVKS